MTRSYFTGSVPIGFIFMQVNDLPAVVRIVTLFFDMCSGAGFWQSEGCGGVDMR